MPKIATRCRANMTRWAFAAMDSAAFPKSISRNASATSRHFLQVEASSPISAMARASAICCGAAA
jgi:hypothetical protein